MIIQVGQAIGPLRTIASSSPTRSLGAALMRSQGRAAWRRFNRALRRGPRARARGRSTARSSLRRRAAADARLLHRHPRGALPAAAHAARRSARSCCGRPAPVRRRHALRRWRRRGPPRRRRAAAATGTSRAPRTRSTRRPRAAAPVTVDPALEAPRPAAGDGFSDAVDVRLRRPAAPTSSASRALGLAGGGARAGWSLLFHGGEPVARQGRGRRRGRPVGRRGTAWRAAGARHVGRRAARALDARSSPPTRRRLRPRARGARRAGRARRARPAARAGGMTGYEQRCRVTGTAHGRRPPDGDRLPRPARALVGRAGLGRAWRWPARSAPGSTTTSA